MDKGNVLANRERETKEPPKQAMTYEFKFSEFPQL